MADEFKKNARSYESWCNHDTQTVSYAGCRKCWAKVKKRQRKIARKKMKIVDSAKNIFLYKNVIDL